MDINLIHGGVDQRVPTENSQKNCFNIKWPKTLSNQDLYEKTKIVEWKKKVTVRRLKWFGKMARAPEGILAKVALRYGLSNYARP